MLKYQELFEINEKIQRLDIKFRIYKYLCLDFITKRWLHQFCEIIDLIQQNENTWRDTWD